MAQWSSSRPFVKKVQVSTLSLTVFFFVYIYFRFVSFFNQIFPFGLLLFILTAGPLQLCEVFAINVFLVMFKLVIAIAKCQRAKIYLYTRAVEFV